MLHDLEVERFLGPLFTEQGSHLYRFPVLAAKGLLSACRDYRSEIEQGKTRQSDMPQAEEKLKAVFLALEIALRPPVKADGTFVDPRDNPEWVKEPTVAQVNIAQQLVEARNGVFSGLGFSELSAHEVVLKVGRATLDAVRFLRQAKDQATWDYLVGPASPLCTETRGLGLIPADEVRRVEKECEREAAEAWRRAKAQGDRGKGVSWQEAREYLEACWLRGEPFTTYQDMAARVGCSPSTIQKAVKNGQVELQEWADKQPSPSRLNVSPEAAALALKTTPQNCEPDPGDALEQADEDAALQLLREQAAKGGPEMVAQINKLDPAARRKMADLVYRDPDRAEQAERHRRAAKLKRRD